MPLYKQDKLREKCNNKLLQCFANRFLIVANYIKTYEQPKFDDEGKLIMYVFGS